MILLIVSVKLRFLPGLNGNGGIGNGGGGRDDGVTGGNQGGPNDCEEFLGGYSVP